MGTKIWATAAILLVLQVNWTLCQTKIPPWVTTQSTPLPGPTFLHLESGKTVPYNACYTIRNNAINDLAFQVDLGNDNVAKLPCTSILRLGIPCNIVLEDFTVSSDLFTEALRCQPNDMIVELSNGVLLSYDLFSSQVLSESPRLAVPKLPVLPDIDFNALTSGDFVATKVKPSPVIQKPLPPLPVVPTQVGNPPVYEAPPANSPYPPQPYPPQPVIIQALTQPITPPCLPTPCPPPCPPPCLPTPCPPPCPPPCLPTPCPPPCLPPCLPTPCPPPCPPPCLPTPCPPPCPPPCLPTPCPPPCPPPCLPTPCPPPCLPEPCPPPCLPEPCPPPCLPEPCPPPCLPEPCPPPCLPKPCHSPCSPPCLPEPCPPTCLEPCSPHHIEPCPCSHNPCPHIHSCHSAPCLPEPCPPPCERDIVTLWDHLIHPPVSCTPLPAHIPHRPTCCPSNFRLPYSTCFPNIHPSLYPSASRCPF